MNEQKSPALNEWVMMTGRNRMSAIWRRTVFLMCTIGCFCAGCANYNAQTQRIKNYYEQGDMQAAATCVATEADSHGEGKDAIVWRLEQGAVLRAAGRLVESNHAFDQAEEKINKHEASARVSVSREALVTVTNLKNLPYEGFAYDKIMMNTYKALNYLELGDFEKARVELNRAYERQKDAIYINSKRIEKALDEGKKQNFNVDVDAVNNNSRFQNQFDRYYADLDQLKAYSDYVNPASVYLDGLFFMAQAMGSSDLERARNSFERVRVMAGENKFFQQDLETLQQLINGQPIPATTYVFFETGQAPEREEIRIDLPLFLIIPGVPYVGAAFPELRYRGNYLSSLNVLHNGTKETTELLASMDAVVGREFKNELPIIITRTIIASAIKAAATYGAYSGVTNGGRDNAGAGFAVLIAGAIFQATMNQADLRTWTTLPKEFQLCRFPTPANRKIELGSPYSGTKVPVTVDDGIINVVWVKSVNSNSPLLVKQFKLKDGIKGAGAITQTAQPENPPARQLPPPQEPNAGQSKQASSPNAVGCKDGDKRPEALNTAGKSREQQIDLLQSEVLKNLEDRDWNAGIENCKRLLAFDPKDYFAYANLGCIYAMLNQFDVSIEYATKASALKPSLPGAYLQMVYAYARKGDRGLAFESLQKAVDRGFTDIDYLKSDVDLPADFRNDPQLNDYR